MCRKVKFIPSSRSIMCDGEPCLSHWQGFSFKYLAPWRCVCQLYEWCMGMCMAETMVGTWGVAMWSVSVSWVYEWLCLCVGWVLRCEVCVVHYDVSSCVSCVQDSSVVMAYMPGDDASR